VKGLLYGVVRPTRPAALLLLVGLSAALGAARAIVYRTEGLRAEYAAPSLTNEVRIRTDRAISTRAIVAAWDGAVPDQFQVRWSGYVVAAASGLYTFSTTSDDGSTVLIDGMRVVATGCAWTTTRATTARKRAAAPLC
jgi:hypothetical protein